MRSALPICKFYSITQPNLWSWWLRGQFGKLTQGYVAAAHQPHYSSSRRLHVRDLTTKHEFLIDSGSDFSVLPPRYSRFNGTNKSKLTPIFSVFGANNSRIDTYGYETRKIDLGLSKKFEWTFIIADVDRPIIGADFLYEFNLIPDLRLQKLIESGQHTVKCTSKKPRTSGVHIISQPDDAYSQLLAKYPSLIRPAPFLETPKHPVEHYIETTGPPVFAKPRRLRHEMFVRAKKEFDEMLRLGIVRRSKSPWASPLLLREKGANELRPCGDYRQLNTITTPDRYPLPNMNDVPPKIQHAKLFSVIDLVKAFHHIPVRECDIEKTAVTTPFGLFEYLRMPFGLRNAPQTYQRFMDAMFRDFDFVICYLDDILIFSANEEEHLRHLEMVLKRLHEYGLTINPRKCQLGKTKVKFLGHDVSAEGFEPTESNVERILKLPLPQNVHELRRAIGSFSFYRAHMPNIASLLAPLNDMIKGHPKKRDKTPVNWTEDTKKAFEECKKLLASATQLAVPNFSCPFMLTTDASDIAIGAVLEQMRPDGTIEPLGFFSQKLTEPQQRYPVYDRELLAIYEAVQHFRHLIEGHPDFTVYTDHQPLTFAYTKQPISNKRYNARRAAHLDSIAQLTTNIKYVAGKANIVADMLSRINSISASVTPEEIAQAQNTCPELQAWKNGTSLIPLKLSGYLLPDGTSIWCHENENNGPKQMYVPSTLRMKVFQQVHDLSHPGPKATLNLVKKRYIWPGINQDVRLWAKACQPCQKNKTSRHTHSPYQPLPLSDKLDHVHIDIVGPLAESNGKKYLLTMIDRFSRWCEYIPIRNIEAETVARKFFEEWVCRYGVPKQVTTDRGTQFTSALHGELIALLGADHITTTAYHPSANGIIERTHRRLKQALRCHKKTWTEALPVVLLGFRSVCREDFPYSPAEALFGQSLRLPGEFFETHTTTSTLPLPAYIDQLKTWFKEFRPCPAEHKTSRSFFVHKDLNTCTKVYIRVDKARKPLDCVYEGPYPVIQRHNKYFILDVNGKQNTVSIDRLKPAYFFMAPPNETEDIKNIPLHNNEAANIPWSTLPYEVDNSLSTQSVADKGNKTPINISSNSTYTRAGRLVQAPSRLGYLNSLTKNHARHLSWATTLVTIYKYNKN
ncbi:uncharacterized protein LOC135840687 isoform X1 [Planococcus citri]|uniref:uncharacterized protein LOC135840687 isoform X1 n=1 Tax=Planococcus citri TaxID=170843 RepID=UPI0031F8E802